jgi:hypothetical protein
MDEQTEQPGPDHSATERPGSGHAGPEHPGDVAPAGTPGTGEAICPRCDGRGDIDGRPCPDCGGSGKVVEGIGGG